METRSAVAGAISPEGCRKMLPRKCKKDSDAAGNTGVNRPAKRRRTQQEPFIPDESNTLDISGMSIEGALSLPSKTFRKFQKKDVFWVKTKWGLVRFRPSPWEKGNIRIHFGEALVRDYPYSDGHLSNYEQILSNIFKNKKNIKGIASDIKNGTSYYLKDGNQTRAVSLLVALQVFSERERRHIPVKKRFMNTLKHIAENGCKEGCSPQSLLEESCPWICEKGVKIACVEHRKEIDGAIENSTKENGTEGRSRIELLSAGRPRDERRPTEATTCERYKVPGQTIHSKDSVKKALPFFQRMCTRSQSNMELLGENISCNLGY